MLAFLIAVVAGALSPRAVPMLKSRTGEMFASAPRLTETEAHVLAFALAMVLAGLLAFLMDADAPLGLALGGFLGRFGARIVDLVRNRT